jgi:predicted nucleotidyltransferase
MNRAELPFTVKELRPWDTVFHLAGRLDKDSWMLVGGLMTQAHAMIAGYEFRVTDDIDMLIDVMADTRNISAVVATVEALGFRKREPGFRGSPFHRFIKENLIVDVLVAEHLPSRKREAAKIDRWKVMEIPGGAQAIERRMTLGITDGQENRELRIPDLLGALVLKAAAYAADNRDKDRHLEDVALLSSLIIDHANELSRLHGSDQRRLRKVAVALADHNHAAWLRLPVDRRIAGQDTLRILSA